MLHNIVFIKDASVIVTYFCGRFDISGCLQNGFAVLDANGKFAILTLLCFSILSDYMCVEY